MYNGNNKMTEPVGVTNVRMVEPDDEEIDLIALAMGVLKRWKLCVAICSVVILVALAYCLLKTPVYQASATLFVAPGETKVLSATGEAVNKTAGVDGRTFMTTQVAAVKNDALIRKVFDQFNLWSHENYAKALDPTGGFVKSQLDVKQVPNTSYLEISVKDTDAKKAAEMANFLMHAYIEGQFERAMRVTREARDTVATELEKSAKKYEAISQEITQFRESMHYTPGTVERLQSYINKLDEGIVQARLGTAKQFGVNTEKLALELQKERNKAQSDLMVAYRNEEAYKSLSYRYELAESEHRSLLARVAEFDLILRTKSGVSGVYEVVEEARVPTTKFAPKRLMIMAVAALGAGAFSVFLCVLLELFDRTLKNKEEVERLMQAPVVATMGKDVDENADTAMKLKLMAQLHTAKVIALTSVQSAENRTIAAIRLAKACAQSGARTVLVNADPKSNRIETTLGLSGAGFTDMLSGTAVEAPKVSDNMCAVGIGSLASRLETYTVEPLESLIEKLSASYEVVLVNAPELLDSAFARRLVSMKDVSTVTTVTLHTTKQDKVNDYRSEFSLLGGREKAVIVADC